MGVRARREFEVLWQERIPIGYCNEEKEMGQQTKKLVRNSLAWVVARLDTTLNRTPNIPFSNAPDRTT